MYPFLIDKEYKRRDIYKIIGLPEDTHGGIWDTGYWQHKDDFFIFANINTAGRTGDDYDNKFDEQGYFHWFAKRNSKIDQPFVQKLLNPPGKVFIFFRYDNTKSFTYAGTGVPCSHLNSPVQISWRIINSTCGEEYSNPADILTEGASHKILINRYERNPAARKECIEKFGYKCIVCGFDFEKIYGTIGKDFIHVHHLKPLAEIDGNYCVNPEKDLRPICPNCHAILHRKTPPLSIAELQQIFYKKDELNDEDR